MYVAINCVYLLKIINLQCSFCASPTLELSACRRIKLYTITIIVCRMSAWNVYLLGLHAALNWLLYEKLVMGIKFGPNIRCELVYICMCMGLISAQIPRFFSMKILGLVFIIINKKALLDNSIILSWFHVFGKRSYTHW